MRAFCEMVKEKVSSDEYLALLEYFHGYSNGTITTIGLQDLVEDLLRKYPGFFHEFLYVSKLCDGLTPSIDSVDSSNRRKNKEPGSDQGVGEINRNNKKIRLTYSSVQKPNPESTPRNKTKDPWLRALGFCEKVRKETSSDYYLTLLKSLHDFGTGKITMVGLKTMVVDYFPDFVDDFIEVLKFYESLTQLSSEPEEQMKPNKNMSNMITPSYKFLPKNLSGVQSSGIDELGQEVFNFCCFSEGSCHFKVWPKDPYEKMLNKHEDELFVRDMLVAWKRSTMENSTKLLKAIINGEIERPIDVNKHFNGYNFRFIEKMYGEEGLNMVDYLRQSAEIALAIIIKRLNQMEIKSFTSLGTKN